MVWLYLIAFIGRNNAVYAKITMSEDVGLSTTAYDLGRNFLHRYAIFGASNAGMHPWSARK